MFWIILGVATIYLIQVINVLHNLTTWSYSYKKDVIIDLIPFMPLLKIIHELVDDFIRLK
jgi:hypothetical protein